MESLRWVWHKIRYMPRWLARGLLVTFGAVMLVYYPIGMMYVHVIDDDPLYQPGSFAVPGGSRSVAISAALINREIHKHSWTSNDPFFMPGYMLDRMPAFQRGIMASLSRFTIELSDQLGRMRGSSQVDPDLEKAAGLLKYAPDVWIFDLSTSMLPTASTEQQYDSWPRERPCSTGGPTTSWPRLSA